MTAYEASLKDKRDFLNSINTAEKRGEIRGEKRGEKRGEIKKQHEIAKSMKRAGEDLKFIIKYTGLTVEEINAIKLD